MYKKVIFILACLMAVMIPFCPLTSKTGTTQPVAFPGWPKQFQGVPLHRLPLTSVEQNFYRNFPGKTAKFAVSNRELIVRWVTAPTRKLHPASECFKGSGYRVSYLPLHVDASNMRWGSFKASRTAITVFVNERIDDANGRSWTDVSSWYWAAILGQTNPPWWAFTVVECR